MAVIQISKIQVRRGLSEQLPALDSGEFGWSVDTRQLYIGNGTTAEGAPTPGVTEILTEYSAGAILYNINQLESDVANLQANVTTIQSELSALQPTTVLLPDNQTTTTGIVVQSLIPARIFYNIVRNATNRIGTLKIANYNGSEVYDDEYDENAPTGVTFSISQVGSTTNVEVFCTTTSTGFSANINYTIQSA
jgi:hypothetical protein